MRDSIARQVKRKLCLKRLSGKMQREIINTHRHSYCVTCIHLSFILLLIAFFPASFASLQLHFNSKHLRNECLHSRITIKSHINYSFTFKVLS